MAGKLVTGKVVSYIGSSDIRIISEADWDAVNIKQDGAEWSSRNGWQIPIEFFCDDALVWMQSQSEFAVTSLTVT